MKKAILLHFECQAPNPGETLCVFCGKVCPLPRRNRFEFAWCDFYSPQKSLKWTSWNEKSKRLWLNNELYNYSKNRILGRKNRGPRKESESSKKNVFPKCFKGKPSLELASLVHGGSACTNDIRENARIRTRYCALQSAAQRLNQRRPGRLVCTRLTQLAETGRKLQTFDLSIYDDKYNNDTMHILR